MDVLDAIAGRRSVRGFLPEPVPNETITRILEVSSRAPSGTNTQPWHVWVATGEARERVSKAVLAARGADQKGHVAEYKYYPDAFPEPYLARRRKVGWDLYGLVGIKKGDGARMWEQHNKNFTFFDAPVGLFFTIDKRLEIGSWLDYGMFIGNVMTAARSFGLESCAQVAWAAYHKILRAELGIPEEQTIVCGMSLGYENTDAPENRLRTERAPLVDWVRFAE